MSRVFCWANGLRVGVFVLLFFLFFSHLPFFLVRFDSSGVGMQSGCLGSCFSHRPCCGILAFGGFGSGRPGFQERKGGWIGAILGALLVGIGLLRSVLISVDGETVLFSSLCLVTVNWTCFFACCAHTRSAFLLFRYLAVFCIGIICL